MEQGYFVTYGRCIKSTLWGFAAVIGGIAAGAYGIYPNFCIILTVVGYGWIARGVADIIESRYS